MDDICRICLYSVILLPGAAYRKLDRSGDRKYDITYAI